MTYHFKMSKLLSEIKAYLNLVDGLPGLAEELYNLCNFDLDSLEYEPSTQNYDNHHHLNKDNLVLVNDNFVLVNDFAIHLVPANDLPDLVDNDGNIYTNIN